MRSENISERLEYSSKLDIWNPLLASAKYFSPDVDRFKTKHIKTVLGIPVKLEY